MNNGKISQTEINDSIFDFIFGVALRDATLRAAFTGSKKKLIDSEPMKDVKALVRDYVNNLISGKYKDDDDSKKHDEDYGVLTNEIRDKLHSDFSDFVFGNIQKLVNMTAKYIYIACYADKGKRDCFKYCHCPMDRIMIGTVKSAYKAKIGTNAKRLEIDGKYVKWSSVSWSKIKEDSEQEMTPMSSEIGKTSIEVYRQFQRMVKYLSGCQGIYPIEYDFLYWKRDDDETEQ